MRKEIKFGLFEAVVVVFVVFFIASMIAGALQ